MITGLSAVSSSEICLLLRITIIKERKKLRRSSVEQYLGTGVVNTLFVAMIVTYYYYPIVS